MDIGTAKLSVAERGGIPHHQLDVLDVAETATVARYQQEAAADVERISAAGVLPIIVGGSMMYIQSLLDEWEFPATDTAVRAKWEQRLAEIGAAALHGELVRVDPVVAASILATDGRRIVRALEVVELTGKPFAASAPTIGAPRWTLSSSDWIGRQPFSTIVCSSAPTRCSPTASSTRCARCWAGVCATA